MSYINWQSRILASLGALSLVILVSGLGASWSAMMLLGVGLFVYQIPGLLTDLIGGFLKPKASAKLGWVATVLLCLGPAGLAVFQLGSFNPLLSAGVASVGLVCAVLLGFMVRWLRTRLQLDQWALMIASLQAVVLFALVHWQEATISGLETETLKVRLAAYTATAVMAVVLAFLGAFRIGVMREELRSKPLKAVVILGALLTGGGMLYADQNYFVGYYFWYHVFLFTGVVLALETAFTLALSSLPRKVSTPAAALAGILIAGMVAYFLVGPIQKDSAARSEVNELPSGALVLILIQADSENFSSNHPALGYPKFHDYKPQIKDYNVLLITIDTLRGDYVGPNAPFGDAAPMLSKLAEESTNFTNAYAPSSHTAVSMGSFLNGKYSANLNWRLWVRYKSKLYHPDKITDEFREKIGTRHQYTTVPDPPEGGNLAQRIQDQGLYTMATPFLGPAPFFRKGVGYEQGFTVYNDYKARGRKSPSSRGIVTDSLKQIDSAKGKRWFQWTHLFDAHSSDASPKKYAKMVRHVDDAIAYFSQELKARGLWENTIIVITSDHGEQMGEHGKKYHGVSVFNEEIRIPLIIRVPGTKPRTLDRPVSAVDAAATMISLVGGDMTNLDGVNLAPFILEGTYPKEERPVFVELHRYLKRERTAAYDEKVVIFGKHKLIHNRKTGTYLLFNLEADPAEKSNLIGKLPEIEEKLKSILQAFVGPAEEQHPLPN